MFEMPKYREPDFTEQKFTDAPMRFWKPYP